MSRPWHAENPTLAAFAAMGCLFLVMAISFCGRAIYYHMKSQREQSERAGCERAASSSHAAGNVNVQQPTRANLVAANAMGHEPDLEAGGDEGEDGEAAFQLSSIRIEAALARAASREDQHGGDEPVDDPVGWPGAAGGVRPASHLGHESSEDDKELACIHANSKGTMAASRENTRSCRSSSSEQSGGGTPAPAAAAGGTTATNRSGNDSGAEGERSKLPKDKPRKKKAQKKRGATPKDQDGLEC